MDEPTLSDAFFYEMTERVRERLSPTRFEHAKSVAATAERLAVIYGVDERKARLAGILHDWDKDFDDETICKRAEELGVVLNDDVLKSMPRLLHGPTAAHSLKEEYPQISDDVLQAIARHTSGALDMTPLDMIVYVADVIEPLRPYGGADVICDLIGEADLETLYLATFKKVFLNLIERNKRIHPETVQNWNHYIARLRANPAMKGYV